MLHLYFLVYKLTHEHSQFSPQMVLVVVRILNTSVLVFCVVSVVGQFEFIALFMVSTLWTGSSFIFEQCS